MTITVTVQCSGTRHEHLIVWADVTRILREEALKMRSSDPNEDETFDLYDRHGEKCGQVEVTP